MEPQKVSIRPIIEGKPGAKIHALFNPAEFTLEKGNQYQANALPGLSTPIVQFVNGNADSLSMDLFFDTYTYENGKPVTEYTGKIAALMDINGDMHAPPLVEFQWGTFVFRAILERVSQRFTMFLEDGTPVRATVAVTFKEYKTVQQQIDEVKKNSSDVSKRRVVQQGDALWAIAHDEYQDASRWRDVARANDIDNPRRVPATTVLRLPPVETPR